MACAANATSDLSLVKTPAPIGIHLQLNRCPDGVNADRLLQQPLPAALGRDPALLDCPSFSFTRDAGRSSHQRCNRSSTAELTEPKPRVTLVATPCSPSSPQIRQNGCPSHCPYQSQHRQIDGTPARRTGDESAVVPRHRAVQG